MIMPLFILDFVIVRGAHIFFFQASTKMSTSRLTLVHTFIMEDGIQEELTHANYRLILLQTEEGELQHSSNMKILLRKHFNALCSLISLSLIYLHAAHRVYVCAASGARVNNDLPFMSLQISPGMTEPLQKSPGRRPRRQEKPFQKLRWHDEMLTGLLWC